MVSDIPLFSKIQELLDSPDLRTLSLKKASFDRTVSYKEKLSSYSLGVQEAEDFDKLYQDTYRPLQDLLQTVTSSEQGSLQKYQQLKSEFTKTSKLLEFYKQALESFSAEYLDQLSLLLNDVYYNVFQDVSKRVQLCLKEHRKKKIVSIDIINHVGGKDYPESLEKDQGGAVSIVLGIVLTVYFLVTVGLPRILFLDESFSALHDETLNRFLPYLKQFHDRMGFDYVIISHDAYRLRGYIDKLYDVHNGVYSEIEDIEAYIEQTISGVRQC